MTPAPSLDRQLEVLLSEDIDSVQLRESSWLDTILAGVRGRIVLFGAGCLGRSALRCLQRDGRRPLAFCDNNAALWGTEIQGIPVLSPPAAARSFGAAAAFFVTIWSLGHRYAETHEALTNWGCKQVYPSAPLRWKYAADLLPFFLQDLPHKVYREAAAVQAAFALWSDDRSRAEYLSQIRYRALGDWNGLNAPDPEDSYFLESRYSLLPNEVFIDCGAFDGDTVREVIHRSRGAFSRIVPLEPDPANFAALEDYLATVPSSVASRITPYRYAVSAAPQRVRFAASASESSTITESGDTWVEAVRLDDLVGDLRPTFIKMDIEGAEGDALEGARRTIARHRPLLAVCLYHRQSDLWRIPLLIHSIDPGYRYFLRTHETDGWQTVGYAVPPERLNPAYA